MKKSQLISVAFFVIVIIIGFIVCSVAKVKAENENIQLFKQNIDSDNNLVEFIDLSNNQLNKINVSLPEANVNIVGNSEKSYIEIINLNAFQYATFSSKSVLSIDKNIINTMISNIESGTFDFRGFRDYFRLTSYQDEKKVNIYLSPEDEIKIFNIELENGDVTIKDYAFSSDFNVNLINGSIKIENSPKPSTLNFKTEKGNIDLLNTMPMYIDFETKNGDIMADFSQEFYKNIDIKCDIGKIMYDTKEVPSPYIYTTTTSFAKYKMRTGVGNITVIIPDAPVIEDN